jgi:hypothetical protein
MIPAMAGRLRMGIASIVFYSLGKGSTRWASTSFTSTNLSPTVPQTVLNFHPSLSFPIHTFIHPSPPRPPLTRSPSKAPNRHLPPKINRRYAVLLFPESYKSAAQTSEVGKQEKQRKKPKLKLRPPDFTRKGPVAEIERGVRNGDDSSLGRPRACWLLVAGWAEDTTPTRDSIE